MTILSILTPTEKKIFESPPVFTGRERKKYFTFPPGIMKRIQRLFSEKGSQGKRIMIQAGA
jgi:hypothetical protein